MKKIKIRDDINRSIFLQNYDSIKIRFKEICLNSGALIDKIGFFGEISCPGISDIDALVIGRRETIRKIDVKIQEAIKGSDYFFYCFQHPPVYVLENEIESIKYLHTLNGVVFPYGKSRKVLDDLEEDSDHQNLLYIVWFTFLIKAISGLLSEREVSLRRLLLIDKNVEYSHIFFSNKLGLSLNSSLSSSDLRKKVIHSTTLSPHEKLDVFEIFYNRFLATCQIFDRYCENLSSNISSKSRVLITGKPLAILKSQDTKIHVLRNLSIIETNPFAFHLAKYYLKGYDNYFDTSDFYIKTLSRLSDDYIKIGIKKPFITPFGLPRVSPAYFFVRHLNAAW